ncbi:MAG: allantoinase AllB [Verrucomicrobiae bacterium]|nr:allantoinase AllB [Verrucomicrobiae bacterium]
MPEFDTVIRGGNLVTPTGEVRMDIHISDGRIAGLGPALSSDGAREINADGLVVLPGVIDSHVHINEPGHTEWEGFETGSRAALAGGVTCLVDMPLNSIPTTVTVEALEAKKACATVNCKTDYALWGGLVPGHIDDLEPLGMAGVIGFKAFMCNSGLDEFPYADEVTLRAGMQKIARLPGMVLALHAEDNTLTTALTRKCIESGQNSLEDFLNSRPIEAELLAIRMAINLAGETGCPIHIVHVSCAEGIDLVSEAKAAGVDVTVETCPHYLSLNSEALETAGAVAKCAPPLRKSAAVEALHHKLMEGGIDTIGSDHSPCPASMKEGANIFEAWGGISSLQHAGPITYSLLRDTLKQPLSTIADLLSRKPADRFRLPNKGSIEVGKDADLVLVDFKNTKPITTRELHYRNPHTPYVGLVPTMRIHHTLIRGVPVYSEGKFNSDFHGRFVRPGA